MTNGREFINFSKIYIYGSGLWPESPLTRRLIVFCVLLPMSLIVDFCVFYDFQYTNLSDQITKSTDLLESTSSFIQLFIRKFVLIIHRRVIQEVFSEREKFWDFEVFGETYGKKLFSIMKLAVKVVQIIFIFDFVLAVLICVTALMEKKVTPLESWYFSNKYLNWALFVMQAISFFEVVYLVRAFDGAYLLWCLDVKMQFLLLGQKLKRIEFHLQNENRILNDLICITKHHNLLIRIYKKINTIFSEYFVVQYIITVLGVCAQLYILIYWNPPVEEMIKSAFYLAAVCFQVAMFLMPANDVEQEAENFATGIYASQWELTSSTKIRKQILFMMMRAQEPLVMVGAHIVHVNYGEYIKLFKFAFSISTLLGSINERNVNL